MTKQNYFITLNLLLLVTSSVNAMEQGTSGPSWLPRNQSSQISCNMHDVPLTKSIVFHEISDTSPEAQINGLLAASKTLKERIANLEEQNERQKEANARELANLSEQHAKSSSEFLEKLAPLEASLLALQATSHQQGEQIAALEQRYAAHETAMNENKREMRNLAEQLQRHEDCTAQITALGERMTQQGLTIDRRAFAFEEQLSRVRQDFTQELANLEERQNRKITTLQEQMRCLENNKASDSSVGSLRDRVINLEKCTTNNKANFAMIIQIITPVLKELYPKLVEINYNQSTGVLSSYSLQTNERSFTRRIANLEWSEARFCENISYVADVFRVIFNKHITDGSASFDRGTKTLRYHINHWS